MSRQHWVRLCFAFSGVLLLGLIVFYTTLLTRQNSVLVAITLAILVLVLLSGLMAAAGSRTLGDQLRKEQTRLKRILEENHLTAEKLEYDASTAIAQRRMMMKEVENKDRLLVRMAEILEAAMDEQQQEVAQLAGVVSDEFVNRTELLSKYAKDLGVLGLFHLNELKGPKESVRFEHLLEKEIVRLEPLSQTFGVTVVVENEEEQINVYAHRDQLENFTHRLLETAIRISAGTQINIHLISYHDAEMSEVVRIQLVMNSRELDASQLQQLFMQYLQLQDSDGRDISPGLSPVIVQALVKSMGGQITHEIRDGGQFEFLVLLPLLSETSDQRSEDVY
ncbi:hypothetical protein [Gynuella sp.]|uniref:hypothetical protein n=1 Tax=Gynuella sp. TaxID=2969146 RepID=UPI003D0D59A3